MDMSKPYRAAAAECLPDVVVIFDRFHVMQLVTKAIDKVRRKQQASLDKEDKKTLKGSRFLFLSNYDNLDEEKKTRLQLVLEANEPLLIIHSMKEQLRLLWIKSTRKAARKFLAVWIMDAIDVAITYKTQTGSTALIPLYRLAQSLMAHMKGILNYFDYRITNGKMEGINNKIKTLKRQAYGFRDKVYFRLRLLHLHAQKIRLAG